MACFVLEIGALCGPATPIPHDRLTEGIAPRYLACETQISTVHVASYDRDDGMFVGIVVVWFGQSYRRRATFAAAGPTTFRVTKSGETSRSTYRFAIQVLAHRGSLCHSQIGMWGAPVLLRSSPGCSYGHLWASVR